MFLKYSIFKGYNLELVTSTVKGGVSEGSYSSLNLCFNSGDDEQKVRKNRERLAGAIGVGIDNLYIPHQTHQDRVGIVDRSFLNLPPDAKIRELYGVDALITCERGMAIGVTTADCVPISIYDPKNHVLGVAHAGWKGTVARIGAQTVRAMGERFLSDPNDLLVAIGPSISQDKFEVGDEVGDAFAGSGYDLKEISLRKSETGKLHINLWQANLLSLTEVGVRPQNVEISGICTFLTGDFFSARRQTIKSGRMFTGGVLK